MRCKRLIGAMLSVVCVGALAPPVGAETSYTWEGCTREACSYVMFNDFCACDTDWEDVDNWSGTYYPGYGAGGDDDDATIQRRTFASTCTSPTDDAWFRLNLVTETIDDLTIISEQTGPPHRLRKWPFNLVFWDPYTLTADFVKIDGSEGRIHFEISGGAKLETQ